MTENAKEIVTARGRPSGMTTTITVTAVIRVYKKSLTVFPSHGFGSAARVLSKIVLPNPRTIDKQKTLKPRPAS